MQPAAPSHATRCNGQRSGLQRKGQRHERTAATTHYMYRSAEQRTNIQNRSAKFNIYRVSLPRRKSFKQAIRQKEARLVQNDWTVTNDSSQCRSAHSISTHASTNAKKSHQYRRDSIFFYIFAHGLISQTAVVAVRRVLS